MIKQTGPLLLRDLCSYDVVSAYPSILGKQFYDFDGIDLDNKTERNIFIGKQQIGNEALSNFLITSVDNLVKFYLTDNDVPEEDVIVTQRDGFIIKKLLKNDDQFIDMKLREYIDFLVLSVDRKKFLYCSDGKVTVKGVPYYYEELNKIYQMFANLNFYNKSVLFEQLQMIKNSVLECTDKKLFSIPRGEGKFIISTFTGDMEISDPEFVPLASIDKMKYYKHFIKDFSNSIYLESY